MDNFEQGITLSPESINEDDLMDSAGMDAEVIREWINEGGEGAWVMAPTHVKCRHCHCEFDTNACSSELDATAD